MRAAAQVLLCLLVAGIFTILATIALAVSPIGFVGVPFAFLLFVCFFLLAIHWMRVEWGT